jgi:nucleotide-binding universal stress UspA family protein
MTFNHILVTLDTSELAETVLQYIPAVAAAGSTVHLLSVMESVTVQEVARISSIGGHVFMPMNDEWVNGIRQEENALATTRKDYLQTIANRLHELGLETKLDVIFGDVAETIVERAKSADLLLMATHGRTGFMKLVLGSVVASVLPRVHCPVLVVPANA